ncbi:hydroxyacylglutathione hydrolase [Thiobacillus sedimenti]|uniref:Hydroxyacylglutathione hydrolase n=1 Tax=Thiobacillus sedimenti TaxID=3110231 RepID=A0ABZ1CFA8_9PROT|nr:hydroxyacylglutathione hydrolase [Thiobacillus sp. SCUT-2]WRS38056.1 hydroxyacylglutathione hydrolase [Thiobacillus sp. SCUT-2]
MLTLIPLPAFDDNYIWAWHDGRHAIAVDPGDPAPLIAFLDASGLSLTAVLITHHHRDHTGGNVLLRQRYGCAIHAPDNPRIPGVTHVVRGGDSIELTEPPLRLRVLATPGHTLDHVSYLGEGVLFCGDTVFGCGCGKLFEGDAETMTASLEAILALPDATRVCCAHEYTLSNIAFAKTVDGANPALLARESADGALRARNAPTLPSTLALEKATNPFLRFHEPEMKAFASRYLKRPDPTPAEVFGAIRAAKDAWDG